jgi:glycosyltransferase involved in cell wall biosynthesis
MKSTSLQKQLFPKSIDLTKEEHSEIIINTSDSILQAHTLLEDIKTIEKDLLKNAETNLFPLLALKLAQSKLLVNTIEKPLLISVVFAVYKEHNRIRKPVEHPHGEDFLIKKIKQLKWLFSDTKNIEWELIVVDDGCPEGSGKIAKQIVAENNLGENVKVIFLKDAIENKVNVVDSISSTNESQKGGSIIYGMWYAAQYKGSRNQIIAYTDADLSTHLGQVGLLIDPLLNQDKLVAIGSRREPESVVIKQQARNNRGKLFIYLWKRLLPELGNLVDTQCGFKAFKGEHVPSLIDDLIEMKFAFDIEILLKAELKKKDSIAKVPVAWIDSEAASTTTDLQPYLPMLKKISMMYRKYLHSNSVSDEFASFIDTISEEDLIQLIENIPEEIEKREPFEYIEFDKVGVADLKLCLQQ